MTRYVLDHRLEGERERLGLMSRLLDPMHRRYIEALGIGSGARTLEVGCGNGSVSGWLAERVGPLGQAVAVDLDLSLIEVRARNLEIRQADITAAPIEPKTFDLVTARAVLHHLPDPATAIANMVESLREGGALLLIEPDFLPVAVAEPEEVRKFWEGWLAWSREQGIDYYVGRTLPARLAHLGLSDVEASAETAIYRGGSAWSTYWSQTISELRPRLIESDNLDPPLSTRSCATRATPTGGLKASLSPPLGVEHLAADLVRRPLPLEREHGALRGPEEQPLKASPASKSCRACRGLSRRSAEMGARSSTPAGTR